MGTIIFLLILLFVLWLIFKILKGIISFLFGSNSNEETSSHDVRDDKPSDPKYNNEVYISFRNIVRKAYESYKESGYNVVWESDFDGFNVYDDDSASVGSSIYSAEVRYDDQNHFKLDDPFFIIASYGILFDRRDYGDYEEKAEYLNNRETKGTAIFYTVNTIENSNFGLYSTKFIASNNKALCKNTKELGEAEVFKALFIGAREAYYEGEEIYKNRYK